MTRLMLGDCRTSMRDLPADSVDACVTDPPYELGFMGKAWDASGVAFDPATWAEVFRVLKPGGHLLAFGGTRTVHRIACAIEDARFDIRDQIAWLYGSGFPKSLDVSKAIDKAQGVEGSWRQEDHPGRSGARTAPGDHFGQSDHRSDVNPEGLRHIYDASAPEAQEWSGWGTALKPAFEPIVMARKPLAGTVAATVLGHGTGALNIDGCRIGFRDDADEAESKTKNRHGDFGTEPGRNAVYGDYSMVESKNYDPPGRWPANVVLDDEAAALLDEQTGDLHSQDPATRANQRASSIFGEAGEHLNLGGFGDRGGASRFFYCAKVSRAERNAGLDGFDRKFAPTMGNGIGGKEHDPETATAKANVHPTVKPLDLMRWLLRLVTPPGGTVLDPFLGSGSTGCAAALEGFGFIGCEREPDYLAIAEARIAFWAEHGDDGLRIVRERDAAESNRAKVAEAGQLDLLSGEAAA